ncbi:flagellar protein MotY [Aestuariibacter salexigens]|uniref:flagellar protein MotY n=1 Tax=Aestuariibacter salexigens TaxID=226010 RepID=UPI0006884EC6|nr:OmpA family protein [Aestuariibacter salexigens]
MIRKLWVAVAFASLSSSMASHASLRQYHSEIPSSDWRVETSNRLQCTLAHAIPGYGTALFTSMASKQLNMEFELDMLRLPKNRGVAAVYSVPPSWMPGKPQKRLDDMTIRAQYNGDLPEDTAWTVLSELEKGYQPTVYYQDWYNEFDKVAVSLHASNFMEPYHAFVDCVANLLPYSFEDIAYTVLSYKKNSVELSKYSQRRLAMIGEYLKEDSELELVLLDGYTDSYGGRWNNEQLSIRRATQIKDYFSRMGVAPDRIEVTGHGEKRHVAPNSNDMSRAKNRRVVIRMAKS